MEPNRRLLRISSKHSDTIELSELSMDQTRERESGFNSRGDEDCDTLGGFSHPL